MKYFSLIVLLISFQAPAVAQTTWLKLDLNVDSVKINIDNDFDNIRYYQNGDSIALSPGQHYFVLTWPFDEPAEYYRTLSAGNTTVLMHRFNKEGKITGKVLNRNYAARDYYDSNLIIQTDPDSEIWYKGEKAGTGFLSYNAPRGQLLFEIRNTDFGRKTIQVTNNPERISYGSVYARPEKKFALLLSPIPGAAQLIKRQKKKGLLFFGSALVTGSLLAFSDLRYKDELSTLNNIRNRYVAASSIDRAEELGIQLEEQQEVVNRNETIRNLSVIPVATVLVWNLYDAFFNDPQGGYRKNIPLKTYLKREPLSGRLYPALNLTISK